MVRFSSLQFFILFTFCVCNCVVNAQQHDADSLLQQFITLENESHSPESIRKLHDIIDNIPLEIPQHLLALDILAKAYDAQGDFDNAIKTSKKSVTLAKQNNVKNKEADAYKRIGIYQYYKGANVEAINAYNQALTLFEKLNEPLQQANVLNNIGLANAAMGKLQVALNSYLSAEPIYKEFGNQEDHIDIVYNIALLYLKLGGYDQAVKQLKRVIEKRQALNELQGVSQANKDLALAYNFLGEFTLAEAHLLKALRFYQENETNKVTHQIQYMALLNQFASLYNNLRHSNNAIQYGLACSKIGEKVNFPRINARCFYHLAVAYFSQGDIEKAAHYLTLSDELVTQFNLQESSMVNLNLRSLILANRSKTSEAIDFYYQFLNVQQKDVVERLTNVLNETVKLQMSKFETHILAREVDELYLKENELLLQKKAGDMKRNYLIILLFLFFIVSFFIYHRSVDKKLKAALTLEVHQRTQELEFANQKLLDISFLDGLTLIPNRKSFDNDLQKHWLSARNGEKTFLLLLADVDYFSRYNEAYGHHFGDELLRLLAKTIGENINREDKVYRYDNKKFAIIFNDHNIRSASRLFSIVLDNIRELNIEHSASEYGLVTLSAGLCQYSDDLESMQNLIMSAEQCLKKAKSDGHSRLIIA